MKKLILIILLWPLSSLSQEADSIVYGFYPDPIYNEFYPPPLVIHPKSNIEKEIHRIQSLHDRVNSLEGGYLIHQRTFDLMMEYIERLEVRIEELEKIAKK